MGAAKADGCREFNLGLAPGYDIPAASDSFPSRTRIMRDMMLFLANCGEGIYAFQALGAGKARYGGEGRGVAGVTGPRVFLAHRALMPWLGLLDVYVCLKAPKAIGVGAGGRWRARPRRPAPPRRPPGRLTFCTPRPLPTPLQPLPSSSLALAAPCGRRGAR